MGSYFRNDTKRNINQSIKQSINHWFIKQLKTATVEYRTQHKTLHDDNIWQAIKSIDQMSLTAIDRKRDNLGLQQC